MRGRAFRIALLLVQAVWLNVVVPGHRRGIIALPGEGCEACAVAAAPHPCCQSHGQSQQPAAPAKDPANHCLICYFAARLTPPPVVDLTPPPLRLAESLSPPAAHIITACPPIPTYDGRAPPASA
jgi:hypothetical protein